MALEQKRTLTFQYHSETVSWSYEQLEQQLWQAYCEHPVFINRFNEPLQTRPSLFDLFDRVTKQDADFAFFKSLLLSFMEREPL